MSLIKSSQKVTKYACSPAVDIMVIFNYIWGMPSMKYGETWTPICVPGCSEDYMLHVYICFKSPNLGMVIVCTDHSTTAFEQC